MQDMMRLITSAIMSFFLSSLPNKLLICFISMLLLMSLYVCEVTTTSCNRSCGGIDIPYPFGMSDGCYFNDTYHGNDFRVTCDDENKLYWGETITNTSIQIIQINVTAGHIKTLIQYIGEDCYGESGRPGFSERGQITLQTFVVSTTQNKFTVLGCDTYGQLSHNENDMTFYTACTSYCATGSDVQDGECEGLGCCQVPISQNTRLLDSAAFSYYNHSKVWSFNPCGYAFIADTSVYKFSTKHLKQRPTEEERPVVLEWAISNKTCNDAIKNEQTFACNGQNTRCLDAQNGEGYRCTCLDGYKGNPYLSDGCKDSNECSDPDLNKCVKICKNKDGGYECSCPWGYHGNGRKDGNGCSKALPLVAIIVIGTVVSLTSIFMILIFLHHLIKKRSLIKLRQKFFEQNGGVMLRNQLSSNEGSSSGKTANIFNAEELEIATNQYNKANILGEGGFGTVYKGVLPNKTIIAVKVSKNMERSQVEQFMSGEKKGQVEEFINEVIILSQVNHRHIVKLLGCCLETEVPLLVYEYISNGTLHDHIHNNDKAGSHIMTWETRLRIASETANAISYLHSSASIPIIHRDIKSTNILLDENYVAKVSDFGASRLVSIDTMELSTMVQGTLGYLDPEYLQTSQLTDKSDVYSFGVIIAELLTGRNVLKFDCEDLKDKNLATYFLSALKDNRLPEILEHNILKEESLDRVKEVANIAKTCLRVKGEDRPSMKEVAMQLEGLRLMGKHPWMKDDNEEAQCLIDVKMESSDIYGFGNTSGIEMGYYNTQEQIVYPIDLGR